jgi:hypothetical protein
MQLVGDVPVDSKASVLTLSIYRMDLPAQSSKILIGVEFACVHRGECAYVISVYVALCNSKKNQSRARCDTSY